MAFRLSNARLGLLIAAGMIALTFAAILYRRYGGHKPIEAPVLVPTSSPVPPPSQR